MKIPKPQFEIGSPILTTEGIEGEIIGYCFYDGKWYYSVDPKGSFTDEDLIEISSEEIKQVSPPSTAYQFEFAIGQPMNEQGAVICGICRRYAQVLYYVDYPDFPADCIHWHEIR